MWRRVASLTDGGQTLRQGLRLVRRRTDQREGQERLKSGVDG